MLDKNPEIADKLRPLSIYLSEPTMIRLNSLVDGEALEPDEVSRNFLKGLGLIKKEKEALLQRVAFIHLKVVVKLELGWRGNTVNVFDLLFLQNRPSVDQILRESILKINVVFN